MARTLVAVFFAVMLASSLAQASERRIALVIGNSSYKSAGTLPNTLNDADLISAALKGIGFEVLDGRNLHKEEMGKLLGRFAKTVQGADAGLVYYAGHGLQFDGLNYLLPIDAEIEDEFGLRFEGMRVDDVIATLQYTGGPRILVLDACRNNPFAARLSRKPGTRGISAPGGLAPIKQTQGMLIAYATQANDVATDGEGRDSPFTEALAREIKRPGQEIATVFRNVQKQVYAATKGQQIPELSISLLGDFYLNTGETDVEAWRKVSLSIDRRELNAFITTYPQSSWAEVARMRIQELAEKERFIQESAEREKLIRELDGRAQALSAKIKEAEEKRLEAKAELETKARNPAQETTTNAKAEARSERERLAATVHEQENLVQTLSAERQRIEAERKASEERLRTEPPAPSPPEDKSASLSGGNEPASQPPPIAPRPRNATKYPAVKCSDIIARLQLGDQTEPDLNALKQCQR